MWRAYLASFFLNLGNTNDLIRRLQDDPSLRELCGFGSQLPHRRTFNRFVRVLAEPHHAVMSEQIITSLNGKLKEQRPDLGTEVAVDSTVVRSHCAPHRKTKRSKWTEKSDPEATWTAKNSTQGKDSDGKEWRHGYKIHMIADTVHEVPLSIIVTTASKNDSPLLPVVMYKAQSELPWLQPKSLMADRGYDAMSNFDYLDKQGTLPIIRIKSNPKGTLKEGIYTTDGVPTCIGKIPMEYVKSEDGKHLYKCVGCHLKDSTAGMSTHCDTEVWEDPSRNLRLFGPPHMRRESPEWKSLYQKRQGIERVFRSLKQTRRLERHCMRGLHQVRLHSIMSVIAYQATLLVNHKAGLPEKDARWMVVKVA